MTTDINSHSTSGHYMFTGYPHATKAESQPPSPGDWPSIPAVVGALKPSVRSPLSSIILPEPLYNNPNIPWPGQNGGLMGPTWNPHLLQCDPTGARVELDGTSAVDGVSELRLGERLGLLQQFDENFLAHARSPAITDVGRMQQKAFDLLHSGSSRAAFELDREPSSMRDRYGRHKFGQSVLLARRLVEAGVRLIQVNWPREPDSHVVSNPVWDTHQKNAERVRDVLCPQLDRSFATLIEDLPLRELVGV